VPFVPLIQGQAVNLLSPRITRWSFDQWAGMPALDRIAVATAG
jgi:hypothetical protein